MVGAARDTRVDMEHAYSRRSSISFFAELFRLDGDDSSIILVVLNEGMF